MKIKSEKFHSRRDFLQILGSGMGAALLAGIAGPAPFGISTTLAQGVPDSMQAKKTLGIALVGLGKYSGEQLIPALQKTRLCRLAGLVSGSPSKAREWSARYKVPEKNIYNYDNFDSIADNPDIDIVYVVLPNSMHAEYTIRAAKAGKHVICEKPMATSVEDCQRMIDACRQANKNSSSDTGCILSPTTGK